ncbi:uncharacterized protein MONBRDRAFT_38502 [Monosiga brevicollis MX1]|uniref:C3H1-type domain-containing protein n=1 Tax=Monosiga brevicollis TaxID=81824 RepID=A9V899_MONBE|nr:uncharacterized protein MONBRDRAFT_38502 [Monosiga brevicollis MX1]EDQ86233.1 predicted protein [Monosiga brevicollis MX1]|eukprot:XP_001748903.1 hypothetical protein [Monosiga brevicollis MX1]
MILMTASFHSSGLTCAPALASGLGNMSGAINAQLTGLLTEAGFLRDSAAATEFAQFMSNISPENAFEQATALHVLRLTAQSNTPAAKRVTANPTSATANTPSPATTTPAPATANTPPSTTTTTASASPSRVRSLDLAVDRCAYLPAPFFCREKPFNASPLHMPAAFFVFIFPFSGVPPTIPLIQAQAIHLADQASRPNPKSSRACLTHFQSNSWADKANAPLLFDGKAATTGDSFPDSPVLPPQLISLITPCPTSASRHDRASNTLPKKRAVLQAPQTQLVEDEGSERSVSERLRLRRQQASTASPGNASPGSEDPNDTASQSSAPPPVATTTATTTVSAPSSAPIVPPPRPKKRVRFREGEALLQVRYYELDEAERTDKKTHGMLSPQEPQNEDDTRPNPSHKPYTIPLYLLPTPPAEPNTASGATTSNDSAPPPPPSAPPLILSEEAINQLLMLTSQVAPSIKTPTTSVPSSTAYLPPASAETHMPSSSMRGTRAEYDFPTPGSSTLPPPPPSHPPPSSTSFLPPGSAALARDSYPSSESRHYYPAPDRDRAGRSTADMYSPSETTFQHPRRADTGYMPPSSAAASASNRSYAQPQQGRYAPPQTNDVDFRAPRRRIACRFYNTRGGCRRGNECQFLHETR